MKKKIIIKHAKPTKPNKAKPVRPKARPKVGPKAKARPSKKLPPELYWLAKWEAALARLKKAKSEYKSAHKACGRQQDVLDYIIRRADARTELRVATEAEPKFMRLFAESARTRLIRRKWKA